MAIVFKISDYISICTFHNFINTSDLVKGMNTDIDCIFTINENILIEISKQKYTFQEAYMRGKIKIKGNICDAIKFTNDLLNINSRL